MEQQTSQLPSDSQTKDAQTTERVQEACVSTLRLLSYSHVGSSHTEVGTSNQDYAHFERDSDTAYVAVADGLGSCAFSDEGSELVARQITAKMRSFVGSALTETRNQSQDRVLIRFRTFKIAREYQIKENVRHALEELDEVAFRSAFVKSVEGIRSDLDLLSAKTKIRAEQGNTNTTSIADNRAGIDRWKIRITYTKEDFASTCLFVMTDGKKIFCSHIGDGGIYLICQNRSELLIEPTKGDSLNETIPLTHDEWMDYLRVKILDVPRDALFLCLMTDGFAENISKSDPNVFFQRVVREAMDKTKRGFLGWLGELNEFYESRAFSDDDKTASFIFFRDIFKKDAA